MKTHSDTTSNDDTNSTSNHGGHDNKYKGNSNPKDAENLQYKEIRKETQVSQKRKPTATPPPTMKPTSSPTTTPIKPTSSPTTTPIKNAYQMTIKMQRTDNAKKHENETHCDVRN